MTERPGLTALSLIDGDIYAGYGDYGAGVGPVHIKSVPASGPTGAWTDQQTMDGGQVGPLRGLLSGRIVTPERDDGSDERDSLGFAQRAPDLTWSDLTTAIGLAEHIFDMVEFGGSLWASGADNNPAAPGFGGAAVWRSTDDGATWEQSLIGPRAPDDSSGFQRFYALVVADSALWVRDYQTGASFKWTGSAWVSTAIDPLTDSFGRLPGKPWGDLYAFMDGGRVFTFDGANITEIRTGSSESTTGVGGLDVGDDGALYFAPNTSETFTTIYRVEAGATFPTAVASITKAGGEVYDSICMLAGSTQAVLGTSLGRLALVNL